MAHVSRHYLDAREQSDCCVMSRYSAMLLYLMFFAAMGAWPVPDARAAEDPGALESRVKAAFLYKFTAFVDWPETAFAQPDTPVTIAVIGADLIAAELDRVVAGRKVNDRAVNIRRLRPGDPVDGAHILFIGNSMAAQLARLLQIAKPYPILTVTESEGALAQGSIINFVIADQRVRFEISRESAGESRLRLSSRLLAVAQHVEEAR